MIINPATTWTLQQRFVWRVSTVLLTYFGLMYVVGFLMSSFPGAMEPLLSWLLEHLGPGAYFGLSLACVLSLAFFIGTILKRNPQLQFLVEFVIAFGLYFLAPVS